MGPSQEAQDETSTAQEEQERPKDAKELFALFAKLEGLEAEFVEEKHLALLVMPLESSGKLYFLPPGHMTRVIEKPKPSSLSIGPDKLRMTGPKGEEVMDLKQNEAVRVFVTSLVRVFSGDQEELARSYRIEYSLDPKTDDGWSLALAPLEKPLTEMVKGLTVHGAGRVVRQIVIDEPNGDQTVTKVTKSNSARRFTAEEKLELFGIPLSESAKKNED